MSVRLPHRVPVRGHPTVAIEPFPLHRVPVRGHPTVAIEPWPYQNQPGRYAPTANKATNNKVVSASLLR